MKVKAVFSKTGDMRFISHLDLMRLFQRSLARTALPVTITKGFSPHIKVSIARALKLGVESDAEELVLDLSAGTSPDKVKESLNANLPEGIRIKDVTEY
jgi:radical SAM-linked protein